ncbi:Calcium channel flower [Armadillidium vulgare]|nr:Calcium channel flower [Armadillidium vulgare]
MSSEQEQPWWIKYGARGVGCAGGIIAIILGAFACISLTPICIVAAIWQMLSGFIVVSAEAPFCCMFIDFVDRYSKWVEARPSWQKAALYIGIALPPNFICFFSPSLFFGSGLIFLCGALYGIMAIGKKWWWWSL